MNHSSRALNWQSIISMLLLRLRRYPDSLVIGSMLLVVVGTFLTISLLFGLSQQTIPDQRVIQSRFSPFIIDEATDVEGLLDDMDIGEIMGRYSYPAFGIQIDSLMNTVQKRAEDANWRVLENHQGTNEVVFFRNSNIRGGSKYVFCRVLVSRTTVILGMVEGSYQPSDSPEESESSRIVQSTWQLMDDYLQK